jgi:hypothetical protein
VRGYYRRDGTYVQPHTRRSPCSGCGSVSSSSPSTPRTFSTDDSPSTESSTSSSSGDFDTFTGSSSSRPARTTARTKARVRAWGGTGSAYDDELDDDEEDKRRYSPPVPPPPPPEPEPKYIVYMVNGSKTEILDYVEEPEHYRVTTMHSGKVRFRKESIDRIEQIEVVAKPAE